MTEPIPITAFEIIGYANRLKETMLPAVVPPIFRLKSGNERVFIPPYRFQDGLVCDAVELVPAKLAVLEEKGEVTLLENHFDAGPDREMWIDSDRSVHYEPISSATANLRKIAAEQMELATRALRQGDFDQAETACRVALSADDRLMDPLAVSAAIAGRRNERGNEKLMKKLAMGHLTPTGFDLLVTGYKGQIEVPVAAPDLLSSHPMQGIAAFRPQPLAVQG